MCVWLCFARRMFIGQGQNAARWDGPNAGNRMWSLFVNCTWTLSEMRGSFRQMRGSRTFPNSELRDKMSQMLLCLGAMRMGHLITMMAWPYCFMFVDAESSASSYSMGSWTDIAILFWACDRNSLPKRE